MTVLRYFKVYSMFLSNIKTFLALMFFIYRALCLYFYFFNKAEFSVFCYRNRFWLEKGRTLRLTGRKNLSTKDDVPCSTLISHHNQLLITKFGRILCLTRKWRQKCSPLQVKAPLTEKTWARGWVVLVVTFHSFQD